MFSFRRKMVVSEFKVLLCLSLNYKIQLFLQNKENLKLKQLLDELKYEIVYKTITEKNIKIFLLVGIRNMIIINRLNFSTHHHHQPLAPRFFLIMLLA